MKYGYYNYNNTDINNELDKVIKLKLYNKTNE